MNISVSLGLIQAAWAHFLRTVSPSADTTAVSELLALTMRWDNDTEIVPAKITACVQHGHPASLADLSLSRDELDSIIAQNIAAFTLDDATWNTLDGTAHYSRESLLRMALVKIDSWIHKERGDITVQKIARTVYAGLDLNALEPLTQKSADALRIAFLGDSGMVSQHWATGAGYPDIIAEICARHFSSVSIHNAGIGGNKAPQGLARFDADIAPFRPHYVVMSFGGNDSAVRGDTGGFVVPLPEYKNCLAQLIDKARGFHAVPILKTPDPKFVWHTTEADYAAYRQALVTVAEEQAVLLWQSNTLWRDLDVREFVAVDGIHLNTVGHKRLAAAFLPWLCGR